MKPNKPKATKLPKRMALNQLGKSNMSISDYAKATPSNPTEIVSPLIQLLRKKPYAGA